eukprot:symbB.v1.2.015216.t1/scaffold1115.1/size137032/1
MWHRSWPTRVVFNISWLQLLVCHRMPLELMEHLKNVFLWKELSVSELREECMQRSLSWRTEAEREKLELLERL